jgi:hypothetical protein
MHKGNRLGLTKFLRNHPHPRGIIVCPERKFIYMKATKTAGTSVLRGVLEPSIEGIYHQKDHPQEYQNWLDGLNDEILDDYFIFAIVRNPWDRIVSIATYFDIPLDDFLYRYDYYCQDKRIRIHSLPLHIYTHKNEEQYVDMICRFEALQPDMNLVFDQIGLSRTQLPYHNPTDHHHYSTYYGPDEVELVEKLYQKDITYYGYMFNDNYPGKTSKGKGPYSKLFSKLGLMKK